MTDEHDLSMHVLDSNTDIFEQANVHRVVKKRMKVEEYVNAGF